MCHPVCGMVHIKEPLLLIGKSSLCGGSGFPLWLSEWSLTICLTPYNRISNVLSASLNKTFLSLSFRDIRLDENNAKFIRTLFFSTVYSMYVRVHVCICVYVVCVCGIDHTHTHTRAGDEYTCIKMTGMATEVVNNCNYIFFISPNWGEIYVYIFTNMITLPPIGLQLVLGNQLVE